MKMSRFALSLAIALLLATGLKAQNVVAQWNGIASTTVVTNAKEASVASGAWFAYVHLAMFDAVNAIDHRFQPYLFTTNAPVGASQDAAAIAAAHYVLVHYFPGQQAALDTQFTASKAAIADTPANIVAGEAIGEASAQALIAARASDGLLGNFPYTPPVACRSIACSSCGSNAFNRLPQMRPPTARLVLPSWHPDTPGARHDS